MYAYRKAMPRANKHLEEKWVKHCQKLHKNRLRQMKPAIDNKPPAKYIHLEQNLKKQQMDEERYSQIERENYLLLDKMSHIMTHPQLLDEKYMGAPVTFGKSLNKEYRKRELMRITEENMQILRRIQSKEPHYSHLEWEEQAKRDEEYLRNCAEYPMALPQSTGGSFSKPNSRRGSRRAPSYQRQGQEPSFTQPAPAPVQVRVRQAQRQPSRDEGYDDGVLYGGEEEMGAAGGTGARCRAEVPPSLSSFALLSIFAAMWALTRAMPRAGSSRHQPNQPAMPAVEEEGVGTREETEEGGEGEESARAPAASVDQQAAGGAQEGGGEGGGEGGEEAGEGGGAAAAVASEESGEYEDDFEKTGQTMGSTQPTPREEEAAVAAAATEGGETA